MEIILLNREAKAHRIKFRAGLGMAVSILAAVSHIKIRPRVYRPFYLAGLWDFIARRGEIGDLAIPPIDTGRGRLELPRKKIIELITQSFADASRERVFANKLAIVISPDDASKHEVNLFELRDFLTLSLHV